MKCGVSEVIITPEIGLPMPGYFEERLSEGVRDDLFAQAMVVESGKEVVALASVDIVSIMSPLVAEIRKRVNRETGIPEGHIMVSATHTHTGGPTNCVDFDGYSISAELLERLTSLITGVIVDAYHKRSEAKVIFGSGEENRLSFNRVCLMNDGTYISNPGFRDDIKCASAPVDYHVGVLRMEDAKGNLLGVAVNYANHADSTGGLQYSADWPGVLRRELKKKYGQDVVILTFNGCCGDVNHVDFIGRTYSGKICYAEHIGTHLAEDVEQIIAANNEPEANERVDVRRYLYVSKRRKPTAADIAWADDILKNGTDKIHRMVYAKEIRSLVEHPIETADVEIQAIRIGDVVFTTFPCEAFSCIGLGVREKSPFQKNMIVELANGYLGYVPSKNIFGGKCYETKIARYNSIMPEDAADVMQEKALLLHEGLKEG